MYKFLVKCFTVANSEFTLQIWADDETKARAKAETMTDARCIHSITKVQ